MINAPDILPIYHAGTLMECFNVDNVQKLKRRLAKYNIPYIGKGKECYVLHEQLVKRFESEEQQFDRVKTKNRILED